MSKRLVFHGQKVGYTLVETAHHGRKHNDKHSCAECTVIEKGMTVLRMDPIGKPR